MEGSPDDPHKLFSSVHGIPVQTIQIATKAMCIPGCGVDKRRNIISNDWNIYFRIVRQEDNFRVDFFRYILDKDIIMP